MQNWESLIIHPQATISETIEILDKGGQRIALVTDQNRRLLGTVTDGDIRRALINHLTLDLPVERIMCNTPKTASVNWSKDLILSTIEKYQLMQLPIVDTDGRVVGLQTLYDVLRNRHRDNPVFLIAGGFGTRLHPLTQDCPKPLLKVGNKPILELILERFIDAGFHRFFISLHYMPEMIKEHFGDGSRWGVNIQYVHETKPLGTGGALGLLPHSEIDLPLFMMNGDLLTSLDFQSLLDFHYDHQGIATMCVRQYEHCVPFGVIDFHGHRVASIVEKPVQRFFINAGIYVLSPELIRGVHPEVRIDMPDLLQEHINKGNNVNMFPIHEYWLDIGRMDDFNKAQKDITSPNFSFNLPL
ncbi:nucleotidyltransferase family protein [Legionella hackeliae]|uniref:Similar to Nucleotidyl transferase n=1 Tax=Legionella hackeliae TaxID=449 RepID=A0A0A8UT15_LEGHA|nr:nucleotidyltransferase family protein [Legionella hackeliae]KTD08794.1 mannose-1-phosphate guanyltransferase [Legionella hackeliae]CEK10222.1 Similar to Nucleotidyl transferase [Legionella hackeliae]STX46951.1 mannose-1-phosphate guanylyltransferase [Legionella hackeliae]